ncbi:hypothetical protein HanIR_Chr13g0644791 [Helianthus annuus]|nr:hypothetical protein HanIR_Chr13g0644791 [Helianthus annuus]
MKRDPTRRQILPPALLSINQHRRISNPKSGGTERRRCFNNRRSTRYQILDNQTGLIRLKNAFDWFRSAVMFDFFTAH